jgi:hypothetical protein
MREYKNRPYHQLDSIQEKQNEREKIGENKNKKLAAK